MATHQRSLRNFVEDQSRLVVELAPEGFAIYRLALLGLAAGGLAVCLWLARTLKANPDTLPEKRQKPVHLATGPSFVLFSAGGIAAADGRKKLRTPCCKDRRSPDAAM